MELCSIKDQESRHTRCYLAVIFCLTALGCAPLPGLNMPEPLPPIVREHKHITIRQKRAVNTGIYLNKGDVYSILADTFAKRYYMTAKIGDEGVSSDPYHTNAARSGYLHLGSHERIATGVDIIVWEREDYDRITVFLEAMKESNPDNDELIAAVEYLEKYKGVATARAKTSKQIQETKKRIQALKEEPKMSEEAKRNSQQIIVELEAKLATLTATLTQLEEMKKELSQEKEKTSLLTKELEQMEKKEKDLLTKLKYGPKTAPVIVIASPRDNIAFCCHWCALGAVDIAGVSRFEYPTNVQIIRVMCSGRIDAKFIERALELNAAGVLVAGCEFPTCHYINGNDKCKDRIERLKKKLSKKNIDTNKIWDVWLSAADGPKFVSTVKNMVQELKLGR